MTEDREKLKNDLIALDNQIQENEQLSDELKKEQREWNKQLEESIWQMRQQEGQVLSLYQELAYFGDKKAYYNQEETQEIHRNVQSIFRSQDETVESSFRKSNKQLENTHEQLLKERGALKW